MEATQKDELFDDALCGIVKFTDVTTTAQKPAEPEKKVESKLRIQEKRKPLRTQPASKRMQNMSLLKLGTMQEL